MSLHLNFPKRVGVRPGHPFSQYIAVSGGVTEPMPRISTVRPLPGLWFPGRKPTVHYVQFKGLCPRIAEGMTVWANSPNRV